MPKLDPADGNMVLINTFTVEPENAEHLLDELKKATDERMRGLQGFVSANLHLSDDRRHVTNYAQWRSREDYDAAMQDPAVLEHIAGAARIATNFDPIFYELRFSISAAPN